MAKRDEFPENQTLPARIRCIMQAQTVMRTTLQHAQRVIEQQVDDSPLKKMMLEQIAEALAEADVASMAITGETPQTGDDRRWQTLK